MSTPDSLQDADQVTATDTTDEEVNGHTRDQWGQLLDGEEGQVWGQLQSASSTPQDPAVRGEPGWRHRWFFL